MHSNVACKLCKQCANLTEAQACYNSRIWKLDLHSVKRLQIELHSCTFHSSAHTYLLLQHAKMHRHNIQMTGPAYFGTKSCEKTGHAETYAACLESSSRSAPAVPLSGKKS